MKTPFELKQKNLELKEKLFCCRIAHQKLYLELEKAKRELQEAKRELQDLKKIKDSGKFGRALIKIHGNYIRLKLFLLSSIKKQSDNCQQELCTKLESYVNFKPYSVKILETALTNRPKILHVIGNFITGGSSRLVVDLIEHLGNEFEQEVITPYLPDPPCYTGLKISAYPFPISSNELLIYLKEYKPDIVHVHYWGDNEWEWYHQVFQLAGEMNCQIIENVNTPVDPYVHPKIRYYVYVSNYVREKYGFLDEQDIIIYPGSDFTFFSNADQPPLLDECIGMVYRLDSDKLNESSINVFLEVVKRREQTKVLIVGGGLYFDQYQDIVKEAGLKNSFEFTGYVSYDKLPDYYKRMKLFVAPVWKESFGQVSPFAMSMGLPVVGYNVGALSEIIDDPQLLARPGDSNGLANIIIELLEDPDRLLDIGKRNSKRAQSLFSVESMIDNYRSLYNKILNSSS